MLRSFALWRFTGPAAAPLVLTMAVALAGPGGVLEPPHEEPSSAITAPAAPVMSPRTNAPDDVAVGSGGVDDSDVAHELSDNENSNASSDSDQTDERGCVEALTEKANSRTELEEHVADADKPAGGDLGNQNALDHQCGGAFAADSGETDALIADGSSHGNASGNSQASDGGPPTDNAGGKKKAGPGQ